MSVTSLPFLQFAILNFLLFPEPINSYHFLLKLVWVDFLSLTTKILTYILTFPATLLPLSRFFFWLIVHSANVSYSTHSPLSLNLGRRHCLLLNIDSRCYETWHIPSIIPAPLMFQRPKIPSVFWILYLGFLQDLSPSDTTSLFYHLIFFLH